MSVEILDFVRDQSYCNFSNIDKQMIFVIFLIEKEVNKASFKYTIKFYLIQSQITNFTITAKLILLFDVGDITLNEFLL